VDELDRMYRRLVQNIRASFPDLLTRSFEVSQIYQHIIPYRLNRRELHLDSNDAYELTLMQLLAGTRGLLTGDDDMQNALRQELESANPDLTAFRGFATSTVALDPDALRALDAQPMVRSPSPRSPLQANTVTKEEVAMRATEELALDGPSIERGADKGARSARPRTSPTPTPVAIPRPASDRCRYCGGALPEGREYTFCPHCGQNLKVKHCPACSTELEVEWQFCITCGRQTE
jgi:hypothetical protein